MGRNILVVEDDRNISDLIHMYLVKEGFDVLIFKMLMKAMVMLNALLILQGNWREINAMLLSTLVDSF